MKLEPNFRQLRMLATVRGQQWLIREDRLHQFAFDAINAEETLLTAAQLDVGDFFDVRRPVEMTPDGVAVIEVKGALMHEAPKFYEDLGLVTRYGTLIKEIEQAEDAGATGVLFKVNSPGGTVSGCIEASMAIADIDVPKVAWCNGLACSAAYKLAVGCDDIVASPSAEVGNIGTIRKWADCTEFWREAGIEFKALVSEGADLKSTGHLEPNETQVAFLQEGVDEAGAEFRDWVETNRPGIDPEVFRAGWYSGDRAESLGLIDAQGGFREALAHLTLAGRAEVSD